MKSSKTLKGHGLGNNFFTFEQYLVVIMYSSGSMDKYFLLFKQTGRK